VFISEQAYYIAYTRVFHNGGTLSQIKDILLAFRPKTLTAALVPCLAATALVYALHLHVDWATLGEALAAAFLIQIGTNFVNDAVDFKKGADTEKRIGPRRITQAGVLKGSQVMALGTLFFALAVLCGIPLVLKGGLVIVILGIASVLMGYAYTAGPFPLAYLGLGDVFVILFFGLAAVMGLFYLQTGSWNKDALVLGLQIGFHATVLLAINNLRDIEGDRPVNKKTLPVRFGVSFARKEIALLAFLPFVMNLYWAYQGFYWTALLPLLALPLAVKITKNVYANEPSPLYNKFLGQSAGLHLLFGLLLTLGFLLR